MKKTITIILIVLSGTYSLGQTKFENFKFDTTITGFHFAAEWAGTRIYTPNGKSDLAAINPSAFSFSIYPTSDFKGAVSELDKLLGMSQNGGYSILDMKKTDTLINGNKAYIISYTEDLKSENYKNFVYNAVVAKGETIIVFTSGDLDNRKYSEKFKQTLYSLK